MRRRGVAGDNFVMVPLFFFMIIIIVITVVAVRFITIGDNYDARDDEAVVMYRLLHTCVAEKDVFDVEDITLLETCGFAKEGLFDYLLLVVNTETNQEVFAGTRDYDVRCDIENPGVPTCRRGFVEKEGIRYEIVVAAGQDSRRRVL